MYSAIEHKGDVAKAFGPSFVKRGNGEHLESVLSIGQFIAPISERDGLILWHTKDLTFK